MIILIILLAIYVNREGYHSYDKALKQLNQYKIYVEKELEKRNFIDKIIKEFN